MNYKKDNTIIIALNKESFEQDLCNYETMFNDPVTTKLTSNGRFPYDPEITRANIKSSDCLLWSIHREDNPEERHIPFGLVSLQRINLVDQSAEFTIILGNHRKAGHGYRAAWMAIDHGFRRLGLNRIWTGTSVLNIAMQGIAGKLGMVNEGCLKEAMTTEGRQVDILMYAILKKKWR